VLLTCYAFVLLRGFDIAASTREPVGRLVALGVTELVATQVLVNLGMVTGLLPVVGIPLPFMSYGGSSMLVSMMASDFCSVRMRQFNETHARLGGRECRRGAAVSKRIVVNVGLLETRVAVQEGNLLTELYLERHRHKSIVGSVSKGTVTNVLPGMQAAFVDIGLAKDAFLYAGDYTRISSIQGAPFDADDADPTPSSTATRSRAVRRPAPSRRC
jgi:hypothetical protein